LPIGSGRAQAIRAMLIRIAFFLVLAAVIHAVSARTLSKGVRAHVKVSGSQIPSRAGLMPFTKIADEIHEAELSARDMSWRVGNSSAEKDSVQWFMATTMAELNKLKKETLNASATPGGQPSLAHRYEECYNMTVARMPIYNKSMTLGENLREDSSLAPSTVEAKMYDVYEAEYSVDQLTTELGECEARCPLQDDGDADDAAAASLLAHGRRLRRQVPPAGAPAGALAAASTASLEPQKLMTHIADAISNTSGSIEVMDTHLRKDRAAMDVLESVTSTLVEKLLKAKKDVTQMEADLKDCLATPHSTALHDEVGDAMTLNPDLTEDMVNAAAGTAKSAKQDVDSLKEKVDACKEKCP